MKELKVTPSYLASKIQRSPTYIRNVINGYVPPREWELVLGVMSATLSLPMSELVIGELPRKTA